MSKLPPKIPVSDIDWRVIQYVQMPNYFCAVCHNKGCSWRAVTKKGEGIPVCFGCGDQKDYPR